MYVHGPEFCSSNVLYVRISVLYVRISILYVCIYVNTYIGTYTYPYAFTYLYIPCARVIVNCGRKGDHADL